MEPMSRSIYEAALARQDELRKAAARERMVAQANNGTPGWGDRFYLLAGELMIRLGERLKQRSPASARAAESARP